MREPKRAADLLRGIVREAGPKSGRLKLTRALESALGGESAKHCQVMGYRRGRLVVEVDCAPLFAELSGFQADQIRQTMNDSLKNVKIAQIVFRMGGTGHV